ncbi:CYTH-like domain-containing protein [Aspergillus cavernicola]|uniref:mRNA-capping enzyme subunit beta n=1 Tax=Aspergillus cavernicola TaxID=176166 RepID=A0ABR4IIN4_9EURO
MDLRTIMNSDAAGTSQRPPSPPSHRSPPQLSRKPSGPIYPSHEQLQSSSSSSSYPLSYPNGPPQQPPRLQRAQTSPDRASSYGSLQSPYQYHPAASLNAGAQSQRGPSPPPAPYGPSAMRDSFAAPVAYNHPQHHQSPITNQRSQSIQSVLTPYSSASHSFPPRESSPAAASQAYPPQQFSPPAQGSLPGTPRGSTAVPFHHSTPSSARPQSSGQDSLSNRASSPWFGQDAQIHMSPTAVPRAVRHDSRIFDQTPRRTSFATEQRDSDESVSPRSAFPPGVRRGSLAGHSEQAALAQLNERENGVAAQGNRTHIQNTHSYPVSAASSVSQANSPRSSLGLVANESPKGNPVQPRLPTTSFVAEPGPANSSLQPPKPKRRRYNETPIYAQRTSRTKGRCPMIPHRLPPIPKHIRNTSQSPWFLRQKAALQETPSAKIKSENSVVDAPATAPVTAPVTAPSLPQASVPPQLKSLGPWEPSITGFIPHEEITKIVCDFLFQHVVLRNDAMAGPAGATAVGQGAIIEIEAKLGQLIDQDRGERLQLPILSESVISRENTRLRTNFESNMTQAQHRAMNNFLNEAVKASMPQANPGRIPLSYAHKKERDTFFEVSPSDLPPVIRHNLNPRHKPKVRVTVDQRTGEILGKIVKCRVADLDVHSPRTCVDFRVSVNLEMGYEGDISHLTPADTGRGASDRNKDRMSYRHLAYQVDLTQVARSEPSAKGEFEHELEIEISAAEIRRQGQLAMSGDPTNQYEDLVKGLLDNIRILARAVPP